MRGPTDRYEIATAVRPWIAETELMSAEGAA